MTKRTLCLIPLSLAAALFLNPVDIYGSDDQSETETEMKLKGGEEGTLFKSLRIEGEDRIRIDFERPPLHLDLDPKSAPGLNWETIHAVLERVNLDLMDPYLDRTSTDRPPLFARPWLDHFSTDGVAKFRPALESVDRWQLNVANSHGEMVASFGGKGKPPKEIKWDGLSTTGEPVPPGLTYSYVLEAFDKAGNKRNFVGEGFELPSYRIEGDDTMVMMFSGKEIATTPASPQTPASILLEVASWLNQSEQVDAPIRVEVTARSFGEANLLANDVVAALQALLVGDPLRVQPFTTVEPDAPETGTIAITAQR